MIQTLLGHRALKISATRKVRDAEVGEIGAEAVTAAVASTEDEAAATREAKTTITVTTAVVTAIGRRVAVADTQTAAEATARTTATIAVGAEVGTARRVTHSPTKGGKRLRPLPHHRCD